jgi:mono/diheme cytochrome c family protein
MTRRAAAGLALFLALALAEPSRAEDPFARCAVCHLPDGAGVPGAFPSFRGDVGALAHSPAGRRYLALVVIKGLTGSLTVDGKSYFGAMPAQSGLDDHGVATVLNHVVHDLAKSDAKAFTAAEVARIRASGADLTGADVARLHAPAGGR